MTNMLEIKDLSFKYDINYVFYNMNLNIKKNEFVYLIGTNNSGKTTLINILKNYPYDGQIYINGLEMCNKNSENKQQSAAKSAISGGRMEPNQRS